MQFMFSESCKDSEKAEIYVTIITHLLYDEIKKKMCLGSWHLSWIEKFHEPKHMIFKISST